MMRSIQEANTDRVGSQKHEPVRRRALASLWRSHSCTPISWGSPAVSLRMLLSKPLQLVQN